MTFTAKGGNATDWVIYGNDENGTENFFGDYETFPSTHIANVNAWTSYDGGGLCQRVKCEGNTEYTLSFANTSSLFRISASSTNDVPTANNPVIVQRLVNTTNSNSETFTTPNNAKFIIVQISYDEQELLNSAMLVKGSTAPDHYIPYQKGVGQRTKNLLDVDSYELLLTDTNTYRCAVSLGKLPAGDYTLSYVSASGKSLYIVLRTDITYNNYTASSPYIFRVSANVDEVMVRTTQQTASPWTNVGITDVMLRAADTDAEFIPYGYEIPLSISQTGQTDKTYDIYIGDSPLTEGETVSKTSTGVDIELFEGENVVSTTLYNKPTMEIEASYGVGVKDNNHYIIPFKVNTITYNIQIGDSPLYDGEYLSYKEKKLYKYIDSILTPIDPPSPFQEISTTEGVNKVIIETST